MENALREKSFENQKLRRKVRYYEHIQKNKVIENETKEECVQNDISDKHNDNVRFYYLLELFKTLVLFSLQIQ